MQSLLEISNGFYRGRGKVDEMLRQLAYLTAYRRWGGITPPENSDYGRAMQEGRPSTAYAMAGPAQDFADSVKEFFLSPNHLKRFAPQRYEAISRMLNYRHAEPSTPKAQITTERPRYIRGLDDQAKADLAEWRRLGEELLGSIDEASKDRLRENLAILEDFQLNLNDDSVNAAELVRGLRDAQDKLQALGMIMPRKDSQGDYTYLALLATAPWNLTEGHPNAVRGAGAALVRNIAQESLIVGAQRIKTQSIKDAEEFYTRLGFKKLQPDSPDMVLDLPDLLKFLEESDGLLRRQTLAPTTESIVVDHRSPQIVDDLRSQNITLANQLRQQREQVRTTAAKQRNTRAVQKLIADQEKTVGKFQGSYEQAIAQSRQQTESLRVLEQRVQDLEGRYGQLLNPLNKPYFSEAPQQVKIIKRQLLATQREINALERAAGSAATVREQAQKLQQALDDFTTRRESLKVGSQSSKLDEAIAQLKTDLERAEQELINLPRSPERSQALRDLQRLKAAANSQQSVPSVADLQRQALEPRITQLRQLADGLEGLQQQVDGGKAKLADLQRRLGQLPTRSTELSPEQQARYGQIQKTRQAQGKLPQRVEAYRDLRKSFNEQLAGLQKEQQQLIDNYSLERDSAVNNVGAILENRLERITGNLQILRSLRPGSIAWLVDARNWETGEIPNDLSLVLPNGRGRTRADRLREAATYVTDLVSQVQGAIAEVDRRLEYPNQVSREALGKIEVSLYRWRQIRDALADEQTISDRKVQGLLKEPNRIKALDVIQYGNRLATELDRFNQEFVNLLLGDDSADPKAIIDQSELYRRARESFGREIADTRGAIANSINDALAAGEALQQRVQRDQEQPLIYEVGGKARTLEDLREELQQAKQEIQELLRIPQFATTVEATAEEVERQERRQQTMTAAQQRQERLRELRDELAETNLAIQKRREAAARGQKRGIATDRIEARQRRILRDIEKLAREASNGQDT